MAVGTACSFRCFWICIPVLAFCLVISRTSAVRTRARTSSVVTNPDLSDIVDLSPLFNLGLTDPNETSEKVYLHEGRRLRCCCKDETCEIADLNERNLCEDTFNLRDRNGCGCTVGLGYESFHRAGGTCYVRANKAAKAFSLPLEAALQKVEEAKNVRYVAGWTLTYGGCSKSCGRGMRYRETMTCASGNCSESPPRWTHSIPCTETKGCQWKCSFPEDRPCGWGDVNCLEGDVGNEEVEGTLCQLKAKLENNFPQKSTLLKGCFRPCQHGEAVSSLCAITSNALDKQYGSVANLVDKTCLSDSSGLPSLPKPHLIILMTQELNHVNKLGVGINDFPKYVRPDAIDGYVLGATCTAQLSANTAIFIRADMRQHIFRSEVECMSFVSTKDWTNVKGSTVMAVSTSVGKLVVANWHGHRAGTLSSERVLEFEAAARAILKIEPFQGQRLVVFGGDVNVRSMWGSEAHPPHLDLGKEHKPNEIWKAIGSDILGVKGWTIDQHLNGTVGLDEKVKSGLKQHPLKQATGWDSLCPTKTKAAGDRFISRRVDTGKTKSRTFFGLSMGSQRVYSMKTERVLNLRCVSPADQMSTGKSDVEYVSMDKLWGPSSSSPSYTERIFLSEELSKSCGKAMKDIRHKLNDHDSLFVRCTFPR